eukprot:gnl/TRDRNA2_/TRDRNA2_177255_c0_seq9.p1 gnl/TRDRNA2_/TRDRNA2_177255_c0~~gnl/TRDRNA2_/TRDRNA2_177255_c0_seq9.p1  ORF type:complete len:306 (+),score=59.30 gnl/TRDRNA2_/TRDRNA2_177255_c0_seq9:41-919(+)
MGCHASTLVSSPAAVEPHGRHSKRARSKSVCANAVQDSVFLSKQRWMADDICEESVNLQSYLQNGNCAAATDSISLAELQALGRLDLQPAETEHEAEARKLPSALSYVVDGVPLGRAAIGLAEKGVHELGRATAGLAEVGYEVADTGMHIAATATSMAEKGLQRGLQETRCVAKNVGLPVPETPGEKHIDKLIQNNSTIIFYELEGKVPKPVKKDGNSSFDEEILRQKTGVEDPFPLIFVEGRYIGSEADLAKMVRDEASQRTAGRAKPLSSQSKHAHFQLSCPESQTRERL